MVQRLSAEAKPNGVVGWALGEALEDACVDDLLPLLTVDNDSDRDLALSYFAQRARTGDWEWINGCIDARPQLDPSAIARLLLLIRAFPRAWQEAESRGETVTATFWQEFLPYGLGDDTDTIIVVARQLMLVGRNAAALDLLCLSSHGEGTDSGRFAHLIVAGLQGLAANLDDEALPRLSQYDFQRLFDILEAQRDEVGETLVGQLEWTFLSALGYEALVPTLHRSLSQTPAFFVEVLSAVYRSADSSEDDELDSEPTADAQARANNAYRLLSLWQTPPGLMNGVMSSDQLNQWVDEAIELLAAAGRLNVGMITLGQVLVSSLPDADGSFPPVAVRDLFERLQNEFLEDGFANQVINSRGITSRGLEDGGAQEERLAKKYLADAELFKDVWPRTAAVLRDIAALYESHGRRNEDEAERFRRGLGL